MKNDILRKLMLSSQYSYFKFNFFSQKRAYLVNIAMLHNIDHEDRKRENGKPAILSIYSVFFKTLCSGHIHELDDLTNFPINTLFSTSDLLTKKKKNIMI